MRLDMSKTMLALAEKIWNEKPTEVAERVTFRMVDVMSVSVMP